MVQEEIDEGRAARLTDLGLMREIRDYNEVDCRAMKENITLLRNRSLGG